MAIITCGPKCTHDGRCTDPITEYAGAVLATFERNGYDDSDFYAVVWDESAGRTRNVCYASTRSWTYHNGATVDASEETERKARESLRPLVRDVTLDQARADAERVVKGCSVTSTTTRGKNVGISGQVRWIGEDAYRSSRTLPRYRVGMKVTGEDKLRYLSMDSVERTDAASVDVPAVTRDADEWLARAGWRTLAEPSAWIR